MQPMGLCQNRALRRHKRVRRHPPMLRTASGMQHQPQATEGFRVTLNPKFIVPGHLWPKTRHASYLAPANEAERLAQMRALLGQSGQTCFSL